MTQSTRNAKAVQILGAALALGTSLGMVSHAAASDDNDKPKPGAQMTVKSKGDAAAPAAIQDNSRSVKLTGASSYKYPAPANQVKLKGNTGPSSQKTVKLDSAGKAIKIDGTAQ